MVLPKKTRIKKKWQNILFPVLLVIILLSLFYIPLATTLQQDNFLPCPDSQHRIMLSIRYYKYIFHSLGNPEFLKTEYPPFLQIVTSLFYLIFGANMFITKITMLFFTTVFLFSLYGIGNYYGGKTTAVMLTFMGAGSPWVMIFNREYYSDFPAAAFIALSFYLILKSNYFENREISMLAGLSMAIAFLCKWSAVLVITLPILWFIAPRVIKSWKIGLTFLSALAFAGIFTGLTFYMIFFEGKHSIPGNFFIQYFGYYFVPLSLFIGLSYFQQENFLSLFEASQRKSALAILNFTRTLAIAFILVSPWIIICKDQIYHRYGREYGLPPIISLFSTMDIFTRVIRVIMSSFSYFAYFILAGIAFMFIHGERFYEKIILLLNLLLPAYLILKIAEPSARYFVIWLPFTLILGGYWISHLKNVKIRKLIVVFVLCLGVLNMYGKWLPRKYQNLVEKVRYPIPYKEKGHSYLLLLLYKPVVTGEPPENLRYSLEPAIEYIQRNTLPGLRVRYYYLNLTNPRVLIWDYHFESRIFFRMGKVKSLKSLPEKKDVAVGDQPVVLILYEDNKIGSRKYAQHVANKLSGIYKSLPENDKTFDLGRGINLRILIY